MVAEVLQRTRRRSLVVLLTGLDAAPLEEGLFPVLSSLTARHELIVASVADPRVAEMLAGRVTRKPCTTRRRRRGRWRSGSG